MNELLLNKSPIRAAQNKQRGRMRPAGRHFDMPSVDHVNSTTIPNAPINARYRKIDNHFLTKQQICRPKRVCCLIICCTS